MMSKFDAGNSCNAFSRIAPLLAGAAALSLLTGAALAAPPAAAARHPAPRYVQVAGIFGDDEEEQAAQQREQTQDATIADLSRRVHDLEASLRQLTGQVEDANHRADELEQRMIRMQKDFDYRLCTLSAQQLGASSSSSGEGDQNALPCNSSGDGPARIPMQQDSQGPAYSPSANNGTGLAPPPGVLGTLPAGTPLPKAPPASAPAAGAAPSAGTVASANRSQFDTAMNLLARAQYAEASSAFRAFADANPKDDLAPQAVFWVGDIAYVQKDYPGAARAFAEEIKKYPTSPRAPESMLKLGQALMAMNQKAEGCTTLGALSDKYPKASKTLLHQAREFRKSSACR